MNVVFLVPNLKKCGPINVLLSLLKHLSCEKKIVVSLFGHDDANVLNTIDELGVVHKSLNLHAKDILLHRNRIKKQIQSFNPDVINSHGIQADVALSLIKINAYKVSTVHCNYFEDYTNRFGYVAGRIVARLHCHANNKNNHNICCSESIYYSMKNKLLKCSFIRNGIITKGYTKKVKMKCKNKVTKELGIPKESMLYVFLGVLNKRKNVVELINTFKKYRKTNEYLLVIGDGQQYNKCKKVADSSIKMLGKKQDARNYLLASDVYISNSKAEGLSMSILEAIDAGDSLLLSRITSHEECINIVSGKIAAATFNTKDFLDKKEQVLLSAQKNPESLPTDIEMVISSSRMANEYSSAFKKGMKI